MALLTVRIISPKETIFYGPALSVSSTNSLGKFDILPEHANFITITQNQPISINQPSKRPLTFNFPIAIIYTYKNAVNIYTDIPLK